MTDKKLLKIIDGKNIDSVKAINQKQYSTAATLLETCINEFNQFATTMDENELIKTESYECMKYVYRNLGTVYSEVDSPYYNLRKAISYLEEAAKRNYSSSCRALGNIYDKYNTGFAPEDNWLKDKEKAIYWYKKGISIDGDLACLNNLGYIYVKEKPYLGIFYFTCAYKLGNETSLQNFNSYKNKVSVQCIDYVNNLNVTHTNINDLETEFLGWYNSVGKTYPTPEQQAIIKKKEAITRKATTRAEQTILYIVMMIGGCFCKLPVALFIWITATVIHFWKRKK